MTEKPPLGLMPRHLWIERQETLRFQDVQEAFLRYVRHREKIPQEWVDEYNELVEKRKNDNNPTE